MLDQEAITQHLALLATHRRTLAHLLDQAAQYGGEVFAPPATANGIAEARAEIQRIKAAMRENGVQVEDEPNDEAPPHADLNQPAPASPRLQSSVTVQDNKGTVIGAQFNQQHSVTGNVYNLASDQRNVNTGGGDYAEGNIDKRQGIFISGGTLYGPLVGQRPPQPTQPSAETAPARNQPPSICLNPHLQPPVPRDNDKWASIEVVNEEVPDLIDCRGTLKQVWRILDDDNTAEVVSDTPRPLAWSKSGRPAPNGLATIYCGDSQLLDVARTDQARNVILFTTLLEGDWNPQPPGRYRIRVSIGGKLEGTSFSPLIFEGLLIYQGGADITILSAT